MSGVPEPEPKPSQRKWSWKTMCFLPYSAVSGSPQFDVPDRRVKDEEEKEDEKPKHLSWFQWFVSTFFLTHRDVGCVVVKNSSLGFAKTNEPQISQIEPLPLSERQQRLQAEAAAKAAEVPLPVTLAAPAP